MIDNWYVDRVTPDHKATLEKAIAGPMSLKEAEEAVRQLRFVYPKMDYNVRDGSSATKEDTEALEDRIARLRKALYFYAVADEDDGGKEAKKVLEEEGLWPKE